LVTGVVWADLKFKTCQHWKKCYYFIKCLLLANWPCFFEFLTTSQSFPLIMKNHFLKLSKLDFLTVHKSQFKKLVKINKLSECTKRENYEGKKIRNLDAKKFLVQQQEMIKNSLSKTVKITLLMQIDKLFEVPVRSLWDLLAFTRLQVVNVPVGHIYNLSALLAFTQLQVVNVPVGHIYNLSALLAFTIARLIQSC